MEPARQIMLKGPRFFNRVGLADEMGIGLVTLDKLLRRKENPIPSLSTDKWEERGREMKEKHDMGHRSFDFGLGLGATYNFSEKVFVQLRYTLGLIPLYKDGNARNGNAQLSIGYRF